MTGAESAAERDASPLIGKRDQTLFHYTTLEAEELMRE